MKSYIIRIYRGEKNGSGQFLGTVERPGEDVKLAFTSFNELKDILGPQAGKDVFAKGWEQKGRQAKQGGTSETGGLGSKTDQGKTMGKREGEAKEGQEGE